MLRYYLGCMKWENSNRMKKIVQNLVFFTVLTVFYPIQASSQFTIRNGAQINTNDKLTRQVPVQFRQGRNTSRISLAGLPAGNFTVRLNQENSILNSTILKQ